ncbi:MAG: hypothetical protein AUH21_00690 [Nitrospirae bacterium 13_2_20CM_62_7]|nr:MAG: hypothetical protein AUH21_00690 [Nitrospirae bacterium 13_2_20CM_62_7]
MERATQSRELQGLLGLALRPVAIAFRDAPPRGVPRIDRPAPAGCGYWRLAAEGNLFYTEAPDHYSCPVGAHTHGVELPPETAKELNAIVQTMVGLQYIKLEEIPAIPRRQGAFGVAVYAPLADAPCEPDVVLVRGTVKQLMLLAEAAQAAGVAGGGATMGRPTCAVLPEAMVYTGLGDDEGYYAIPGAKVAEVVSKLAVITEANRQLEVFHLARRVQNPSVS